MTLKIAVLGAGVIGVNTAWFLLEEFPSASVVVFADKFKGDTLSAVAAGFFEPSAFRGLSEKLNKQWLKNSYDFYTQHKHINDAGIFNVTGYVVSNNSPDQTESPDLEDISEHYRVATAEELESASLGNWKHGHFASSLIIDCNYFLPWMMDRLTAKGVKFVDKKVSSIDEFSGDFDLVVNCAGFRARYLCHDRKVTPVRGQVFKVNAPWIKHFYCDDFDTYIFPGKCYVTLGGCHQMGVYNEDVDQHDAKSIWERCLKLVPSLRDCEIVKECVGLRPFRMPVRVEKEMWTTADGKLLKVVHNYGHGGSGVTYAPGSAKYAVDLCKELINGDDKNHCHCECHLPD